MKSIKNLILKSKIILIAISVFSAFSFAESSCLTRYGWCSRISEIQLMSAVDDALSYGNENSLNNAYDSYVNDISSCINELEGCIN